MKYDPLGVVDLMQKFEVSLLICADALYEVIRYGYVNKTCQALCVREWWSVKIYVSETWIELCKVWLSQKCLNCDKLMCVKVCKNVKMVNCDIINILCELAPYG